jgi:hypothetical protein
VVDPEKKLGDRFNTPYEFYFLDLLGEFPKEPDTLKNTREREGKKII